MSHSFLPILYLKVLTSRVDISNIGSEAEVDPAANEVSMFLYLWPKPPGGAGGFKSTLIHWFSPVVPTPHDAHGPREIPGKFSL